MTTKRATIILIEGKSCLAFSRMLILCIFINLNQFGVIIFFILVTCHPDGVYLCEQGVNTGVFFEAKRILKKKTWGALF